MFMYALYFLFSNKSNSHHNGDRVSKWLGKGGWANSIINYLNANIHVPHMAEITRQARAGGRFVFAVHPHSIFGISTLIHFALARLVTRERFENLLDFRVLTINMNFVIPLLREYLMARGFVCADPQTFRDLLNRGISPVIVPGGSEETLFAYSGSADLVLNKRLGFVREALLNNASLIPVYCYGDNEAIPVIRSNRYLRFQRWLQKWLTFATPIIIVFFRRKVPMHMVIGAPLPPPPDSAGSFEERVQLYHAQYKEALKSLFQQFLPVYGTQAEKTGKGIRFIK